jgi:membrane-bound lytic murein transglycosylase A
MEELMLRWFSMAVVLVGLVGVVGCKSKPKAIDFSRELEPGRLALEKISVADHPPFTLQQTRGPELAASAGHSLAYLAKPSSRQFFPYLDITHDRAVATVYAMEQIARRHASGAMGDAELRQLIRNEFDVYRSIGGWNPETNDFSRQVLFTGYFTPIYEASLTRQGEFQWPLYKRPSDLLTDPEGQTASRRTADGQYVLYHKRDEIERNNLLVGNELVYLKSRWDAYVISVQGSAKLRLTDGRQYEVGYSGNNGWPYVSPGRKMLRDGAITKDQLSLRGLADHFARNPADMDKYLHLNPRFVFFTERPGGPFGSLNTPVTPWATVATDKAVYPRAMPSFVMTQVAGDTAYNAWLMDQDTGGGIRAAGRADLYMGIGPNAESMAGRQLHEGRFYYIAVKPEFVAKYLPRPAVSMSR